MTATVAIGRSDLHALRRARLLLGALGDLAEQHFDGPGTSFAMVCDDLDVLIRRCDDALAAPAFIDDIVRGGGRR